MRTWKQITLAGALFAASLLMMAASTTISGMAIINSSLDSSPVGATTPSTGNFTSFKLNGLGASGHTVFGNGTSYVDVAPSLTNCLTTSCAGGSTYVSGTTYTNSNAFPVTEYVVLTGSGGGGGCVGNDANVTVVINSNTVMIAGLYNTCNNSQGVTFTVPPGGTFSATFTHTAGSGPSYALSSWWEQVA